MMEECSFSEVTLPSNQVQCNLYSQCWMKTGTISYLLWELSSPKNWTMGVLLQTTVQRCALCSGWYALCPVYLPLLINADLTTHVIGSVSSPALCFGHIALIVKGPFLSGFDFWLALESYLSAPSFLTRSLFRFSYPCNVPCSCYHTNFHDCSLLITWDFPCQKRLYDLPLGKIIFQHYFS